MAAVGLTVLSVHIYLCVCSLVSDGMIVHRLWQTPTVHYPSDVGKANMFFLYIYIYIYGIYVFVGGWGQGREQKRTGHDELTMHINWHNVALSAFLIFL